MGAVAMEKDPTGVVVNGYPIYGATIYIYCDVCGSFNIRKHIPILNLLIIGGIISAIIYFVLQNERPIVCGLFAVLVACMLFSAWGHKLLQYKCRVCHNTDISMHNSLKYPPYDYSVIDVPKHLTNRLHIESDVDSFENFI